MACSLYYLDTLFACLLRVPESHILEGPAADRESASSSNHATGGRGPSRREVGTARKKESAHAAASPRGAGPHIAPWLLVAALVATALAVILVVAGGGLGCAAVGLSLWVRRRQRCQNARSTHITRTG